MKPENLFEQEIYTTENCGLPWYDLKNAVIVCTGCTGFIGKYLIRVLNRLNDRNRLNMELWLFHRKGSPEFLQAPNIHWIEGNIEQEFLPLDLKPKIIIHAASPADIRACHNNPTELFQCNILATKYLLEQARKNGSTFIFFSTAAIYAAQNENKPLKEIDLKTLINNSEFSLYSASKIGGELFCKNYQKKFGVDCRIIRPFYIHGPGESLESIRFFPDMLRQAIRSREIIVTGTGTPVRDSCYIMDFVIGLLYVLLKGESTTYNIGNEDNSCTILEFAHQIAAQCGDIRVVGPLCQTAHSAGGYLVPDTTKLRKLGWQPQVDLQTCIKRCLESYCENSKTGFE